MSTSISLFVFALYPVYLILIFSNWQSLLNYVIGLWIRSHRFCFLCCCYCLLNRKPKAPTAFHTFLKSATKRIQLFPKIMLTRKSEVKGLSGWWKLTTFVHWFRVKCFLAEVEMLKLAAHLCCVSFLDFGWGSQK